jgi:SAM-dependent methyltransferase
VSVQSPKRGYDNPASLYREGDRYADNWKENFDAQYERYLYEGMTILDAGSGRSPAVSLSKRPANIRYIGLDISAPEMALAPEGSYDEQYPVDLTIHQASLDSQIDLVVSWQVLEHVTPLSAALDNIHSYLKPGGHLVALLSGRNAYFSAFNRMIPERVGILAMKYLLGRPPDTVFPAHYDACTHSELSRLLSDWGEVDIIPIFRGADYFRFFPPLARLYRLYEDWAVRSGKKDLATHYVISASK